ncbi:transposase [Paenibacillus eucommiae]|uniref:Transposase n=1 Tax=Paenibacillus eucommiae TaxID=1355755 RepID=A0ABS4J0F0_9BACL|nr:transposase [Paenibacillus eucommiae]MBP1993318.1 hypothetical protein [Paenibacillus eucommiae]
MTILIFLSAVAIPFLLLLLAWGMPAMKLLIDGIAVLSGYVFVIITALAVYQIIRDNTVFMTNIHNVFNNPAFLASGAYLGNYGLYKLLLMFFKQWRRL